LPTAKVTGEIKAVTGRDPLRGLLHYRRSHDQQHLACLHWLIGKVASTNA